jgi:hypothetical protein
MALGKTRRAFFQEQDQIVQYLSTAINQERTSFIITRPGALIVDRPSKKKLAASKSVRIKSRLLFWLFLLIYIYIYIYIQDTHLFAARFCYS